MWKYCPILNLISLIVSFNIRKIQCTLLLTNFACNICVFQVLPTIPFANCLCINSFNRSLTYSVWQTWKNDLMYTQEFSSGAFVGSSTSFNALITNYTLKVAVTFTRMESLFKARMPNGTVSNIYGTSNVAYGCLLDLQEIFRFSIQIVPSVGWITEGANGTLTGIGAQVRNGQADIGLDISKPVVYRSKYLSFLHAIKQDRVAIMFRQPKIQMYRNILVRPFKDGLWKRVLQSFLAIFVTSAFFYRKRDFHTILLLITGTMLARSVNIGNMLRFSSKSFHIVILVSSLFGLTMYSIYSAFIVSSLRRQVPPVKAFKDLIDFEYELMAQKSLPDFTNVYVKDPAEGRKYASIARKNFINEETSLRKLFETEDNSKYTTSRASSSETGVAWFVLKSDFYYVALQNDYPSRAICDISKLEPTERAEHPRLLAMFIPKKHRNDSAIQYNGPDGMKEHFNRRILDVLARGLVHRNIIRFESEFQPSCLRSRRIRVQQIRFYDVYTAFLVLAYGAGVSLGILLVGEVLIPYFWQITNKHNTIQNGNYNIMPMRFYFVHRPNRIPNIPIVKRKFDQNLKST